ncbi:hypothetical protein UFOVP1082_18 [uncultured Caudovirales phage]|uniref:Uncharacterized protein n=1 Tax=uncultured Caudovirales phage TaxID=2100421 RepID=A0A6J7X9Q1_9CAUD|nr:hypothetical protein UFOVP906_55 [uncultured Caudovirales phage]CAB4176346.1 hypothetical protein UFOVP992_22 [uncultured Caudovirales phage]CAB4183140.1 hypothetical protein UFOVP1082_18 [uncultured Caudovirales phage]CAB4197209.1 hypothetical protein UFOVP1322_3 [uncultured Caudovirales phage]CAB4212521.1 hypothetical protein UFOVP1434_25 [uncultured Caudovirales phage]
MTTYNGFPNYSTWLINLELFDNYDCGAMDFHSSSDRDYDVSMLKDILKEYAEFAICDSSQEEGFAQEIALTFLRDVDWAKLAEIMLDNEAEAKSL